MRTMIRVLTLLLAVAVLAMAVIAAMPSNDLDEIIFRPTLPPTWGPC